MKKIVSILSLVAVTTFLHAQGVVIFNSASLGITTNTGTSHFAGGGELGGTSGKAGTFASGQSYMYQLFVQPYTGTLTPNATNIAGGLGFGWQVATSLGTPIVGTNGALAGGLFGPNAGSGVAVDGWALPSGSTYDTAGRDYFMIAGWSRNLGTSWAAVSALLASGFAGGTNGQFFGVSSIGNGYTGGANALTAQSLFTSNPQTIQGIGTFTLYSVVPIPEPSTIALAGLGSLALLLFRRRK
jgi:hypothetical protein